LTKPGRIRQYQPGITVKIQALFILIALTVSLVTPLSVAVAPSGGGTFLVALDVCGTANPAVSSGSAMPGIHELPCTMSPAGFIGFVEISDVLFHPLLLSSQEEHPPRV
jgi:hypothetical protein